MQQGVKKLAQNYMSFNVQEYQSQPENVLKLLNKPEILKDSQNQAYYPEHMNIYLKYQNQLEAELREQQQL